MRLFLTVLIMYSICSGYTTGISDKPSRSNSPITPNEKSCGNYPSSAPIRNLSENAVQNRNIQIPINYHKIYVQGDWINVQVTVDNQNTEHAMWDIRDYDNDTFLFYPGYVFDFPGHSYDVEWVLPAGNYALFMYDEFGTGGVSATVTSSNGTVLASINQGQWQYYTFLDFTAPEGEFTDGLLSNEIIADQTDVLNAHFNGIGYSFTINSIDSASNAGWYYATDSHKFETGQWDNTDQYLEMAQSMTIDVASSINFFWTAAYFTSGLGVYPWSFEEDDSRHGLFCSNYTHPGTIGTFSEGITAVHEVGHYFGLYHTFENGCLGSGDEVADTPTQFEPNYGCPNSNYSCGSYDDIGNYMDYSDDICLDHFTEGQIDRMASMLSQYRPTLISNNLMGDIDGDGNVSVGDAIIMVSIILGNQPLTEDHLINGDLNNDELLNIFDLLLMVILIWEI